MEPDLAAKLATDLEKHGAQVSVLVGDEDSSTIKKVEKLSNTMLKNGLMLFMQNGHLEAVFTAYSQNTKGF